MLISYKLSDFFLYYITKFTENNIYYYKIKMKKKLFICIFNFLFLCFYLFAQTTVEERIESLDTDSGVMSLSKIDKLISDRDYNEALKELHKYIEKYPERFDNAQSRIKTIMTRRERYSTLTERAIKSSTDNPEDNETPMKILEEMGKIEKNPPEDVKVVIDMLKDMHMFKYYSYLFNKIQTDSANLAMQNKTVEAVQNIQNEGLQGFSLYKEEFLDEWGNNSSIIKESERLEALVLQYVNDFTNEKFRESLENSVQNFIRNVDANRYAEALQDFNQVQRNFTKYSELRNNLNKCANDYRTLYNRQRQINPNITDASYIAFIQRIISGVNDIENSGLVGVLDCEYKNKTELMKESVSRAIKKQSEFYLALLPKTITQLNSDLTSLKDSNIYTVPISNYSNLGKQVSNLYALININDDEFKNSLEYIDSISNKTSKLYSIATDLRVYRENQEVLRQKLNATASLTQESSEYIRDLFDSISAMDKSLGTKKDLLPSTTDGMICKNCNLDWSRQTTKYTGYVDEIFKSAETTVISSWNEISKSFISSASSYESVINEYNQFAEVFHKGFNEPIPEQTYQKLLTDSNALLEYAKKHQSDKKAEIVYVYPDLTLKMTEYMKEVSKGYEDSMLGAQNEFDVNIARHPEWNENKEITTVVNNSRSYMTNKINELDVLKRNVDSVIVNATKDVEQSKIAKTQADSFFSQSERAYNREDYEAAENYLVQANEKYTESLSLQEDTALRLSVDKKQFELSQKITDARNEIVVRQARALYTKARDAQLIDRYDDAQLYINQAINKWAETHAETNNEFEDFRSLVNTAVEMKTGRILLVTDPLYAEMSQLLSIAYQYYDEGKVLYSKSQKDQGDSSLLLAQENLNKIKQVYPINQEASLLMLKIAQLQDPQKFNSELKQKINSAVAKCRNAETQTEGYNELMTYYDLDPNYKGLKDTIDRIEIQLGMRQRPVDNSAIARSNRLTNQAQTYYNNGNLNQALNTVIQALQANPNNSNASVLRDRIETRLGGTTTIVLSSQDNALFTQAKNEYQAGRIDAANITLNKILQNNPDNIKVKAVNDLKKKIDARL